jgi:hypothetical protein
VEKITISCDCGCGKKEEVGSTQACGWFRLSQDIAGRTGGGLEPKINRHMHFYCLACLNRWIEKAFLTLPTLVSHAQGLNPRGMIHNPDVPGLYI